MGELPDSFDRFDFDRELDRHGVSNAEFGRLLGYNPQNWSARKRRPDCPWAAWVALLEGPWPPSKEQLANLPGGVKHRANRKASEPRDQQRPQRECAPTEPVAPEVPVVRPPNPPARKRLFGPTT